MRKITNSEISRTTEKVYTTWFNISSKLSILDIRVLSNVGSCFDRGCQCGAKELSAHLKISKQRISTSLSRWDKLGYLKEVASRSDQRRKFYVPTKKMKGAREVAFKGIREMHQELRGDKPC